MIPFLPIRELARAWSRGAANPAKGWAVRPSVYPWRGIVTHASDEPTAQAQAIMERVLTLVRECRMVVRALKHPPKAGESSSAEASGFSTAR